MRDHSLALASIWVAYEVGNERARAEYDQHPIAAMPVCDICGHNSHRAICKKCARGVRDK